jgi:hypothetical protein
VPSFWISNQLNSQPNAPPKAKCERPGSRGALACLQHYHSRASEQHQQQVCRAVDPRGQAIVSAREAE